MDEFESLLKQANYDPNKIAYLTRGFKYGFSLGFVKPIKGKLQVQSPNLKFTVGDEIDLWNKVMKEVKLKRYAGPFDEIPFSGDFIQSPIGLVPKDNSRDTRLIFHLSYPRRKSGSYSINANTPKAKCTVKYPDFSDAIKLCIKAGKSCGLAKSDFSAAFRNLGILRQHWRYLVMKARSPLDSKWYYFFDKCLPFGAAISCAHFQEVSNAIAHLVVYRTKNPLINYLDDYLFIAALKRWCNQQLQVFLDICDQIKFPVAMDKTQWADCVIIFLGLMIDTVRQVVCIPAEKIMRAVNMLQFVLSKMEKPKGKRKITVLQLQKICGFLNFLNRAVVPGRAFTRRLYGHLSNVNLKPHHHIRLTDEMILDLRTWYQFVKHPSVYCRPFMDFDTTWNAEQIQFYTDASRNYSLGFGGFCNRSWMQSHWGPEVPDLDPSIMYLELYALTAGILAWGSRFANKRVIIFTDNEGVVSVVNNSSSTCKHCMNLVRIITLNSLIHNVRFFAKYVETERNEIADSLSRFQHNRFMQLTRDLDFNEKPTPVPVVLTPITKIWEI